MKGETQATVRKTKQKSIKHNHVHAIFYSGSKEITETLSNTISTLHSLKALAAFQTACLSKGVRSNWMQDISALQQMALEESLSKITLWSCHLYPTSLHFIISAQSSFPNHLPPVWGTLSAANSNSIMFDKPFPNSQQPVRLEPPSLNQAWDLCMPTTKHFTPWCVKLKNYHQAIF